MCIWNRKYTRYCTRIPKWNKNSCEEIKSLSAREYARTTAKKRRDKAAGKQFSKQPKSIARKTKRYRT